MSCLEGLVYRYLGPSARIPSHGCRRDRLNRRSDMIAIPSGRAGPFGSIDSKVRRSTSGTDYVGLSDFVRSRGGSTPKTSLGGPTPKILWGVPPGGVPTPPPGGSRGGGSRPPPPGGGPGPKNRDFWPKNPIFPQKSSSGTVFGGQNFLWEKSCPKIRLEGGSRGGSGPPLRGGPRGVPDPPSGGVRKGGGHPGKISPGENFQKIENF